jgi:probable phosphoglycerate mutase
MNKDRPMIYLVRHGQTEFNAARRYQGSLDSPLTALGVAQARAIGLKLRDLIDPVEAMLFTSPQGRAQETARLIASEAGIATAPVVDEDLAEISLGSWDGLTLAEIDTGWPEAWQKLDRHKWYFDAPGGERYDDFRARLSGALLRVTAHPAASRIIVSHGVASRVLRGLHAGLPCEVALALPVPQGVIWRLDQDTVIAIDCNDSII